MFLTSVVGNTDTVLYFRLCCCIMLCSYVFRIKKKHSKKIEKLSFTELLLTCKKSPHPPISVRPKHSRYRGSVHSGPTSIGTCNSYLDDVEHFLLTQLFVYNGHRCFRVSPLPHHRGDTCFMNAL